MLRVLYVGTLGSVQPHPPKDRVFDKQQGSKKLRGYSAGRERIVSSGKLCVCTASYILCVCWNTQCGLVNGVIM